MVPQLFEYRGELYFADGPILRVYGSDCDSVAWPLGSGWYKEKKDRENLAVALYDMYECGTITERTVALPDGTAFNIDMNIPTKGE